MSETRSYIAPDNILHIAEVVKRRPVRTAWFYLALVLLAIPILVGLIDVLMRADAWFAAHAELKSPALTAEASAADMNNTVLTTSPITPSRLRIDAIGVDASVEPVGLNADGAMKAPSSFTKVGWYKDGALPGDSGSAVFDGHVNNALTKAGVFEHLGQLKSGDTIEVSDAEGNSFVYTVSAVKTYPVDSAPAAEIFSTAGPSQLVLITCDGTWNEAEHQYSNRLVVYATLATGY